MINLLIYTYMKQISHFTLSLLAVLLLIATDIQAKTLVERKTTTYSLENFNALRISGIVKLYFTQSNSYSITVEESPTPDLVTVVGKKGGTLVVQTKSKMKSMTNVVSPIVHIKAPKLSDIHTSGAVTVVLSNLSAENLTVVTSGASKLFLKDVKCNSMQMNTSGASDMTTGTVRCKQLKLGGSGASKLNMTIADNDAAVLLFSGASKGVISYKGNSLELKSSGAGKINLTVDCKKLKAVNSGAAKVTVSGTADDTTINSSGVSKINTSKLNQY